MEKGFHLVQFRQVSRHDGEVGRRLPHILDSLHEEAINYLTHKRQLQIHCAHSTVHTTSLGVSGSSKSTIQSSILRTRFHSIFGFKFFGEVGDDGERKKTGRITNPIFDA